VWIPDATEEYVLAHVTKNDSTGIDVSASHIARVRCAPPHAISPERTQAVVALTCAQVRVDGTGKTVTLAPGTKLANRNLAHVEAAENLTQLQYARLPPVFAESRSVCGGACHWERKVLGRAQHSPQSAAAIPPRPDLHVRLPFARPSSAPAVRGDTVNTAGSAGADIPVRS
jgi:hypothetical protein